MKRHEITGHPVRTDLSSQLTNCGPSHEKLVAGPDKPVWSNLKDHSQFAEVLEAQIALDAERLQAQAEIGSMAVGQAYTADTNISGPNVYL